MTLVLCDDHGMFLDALDQALTGLGHDVVATCGDPAALPEVLLRHRPSLCVLDVQFGGTPRLDAADLARRTVPGMSVLLLTGCVTELVWQCYDTGRVDGIVSKTSDIRVLDVSVRRVLAGDRLVAGFTRPRLPPARPLGDVEPLTEREREVVRLLVEGVSTPMMAASLGVSTNTVRSHVQNVLRKLDVHHRSRAARRAVELGLVPLGRQRD